MNISMVTFLLLLFEVNINFGHTLSKIELENETDIYEVKEDQSALLLTHPKDEATKLREIIYYHIIERPYEGRTKDLPHDKIEPEFEKRLFTNSHSGIQFEKKDCDNDDEDESTSEELYDDSSKENDDSSNNNNNSSESNEEKDDEQSSDNNDLPKDVIIDKGKASSNKYGDNDSINKNNKSDKHDEEKLPIDADSIEIDVRFSDLINTTEGVAKVESTTTYVTAKPETENEAISETPQSRNKRELNYMITEKEIEKGLNHAIGKREGGTYGMSLTGNRGVVWNDVKPIHMRYYVGETEVLTTSKPDVVMAEDIPTTESATEAVTQKSDEIQSDDDGNHDQDEFIGQTYAEIENMLDKLIDKIGKADESESREENHTDGDPEKSSGEYNHDDDNDSSLDPKEIQKTFIEILKVNKELTEDGTRNPAVTDINDAIKSADDADISEEKLSEETLILRTPKEDDYVANGKPVNVGNKLAPKRNDKDKETSNKDNDSKQQQLVKELLKNKYFWAWVKDASAAYLEILMKKLDPLIKTEVGKQIDQYFKEHKNENCNQDKIDQHHAVQEPDQTSNVTDENVKGNTTDTTSSTDYNGSASNDTVPEFFNLSNETNSEISTKKHKDKPSGDKNAESPVKIEAQNLFGSSVGSGNVTNIFIYNMNKAFDLENIKPIKNSTNSIFVLGLDDKKPDQDNEDAFDKDSIHEVETVIPDISSEHNNTADKVIDTDINQTNAEKLEAGKDNQFIEKDNIKDDNQDNVEYSTDKSEIISNDQTNTVTNNGDKTSTEINKEESITENSQEAIKDVKENDATTEKVEPKEDLSDPEIDRSKEMTEVV